jgi:CDP-diglyceride synthetase
MTPTEIKPTADGKGSILTWKLDRAITMAGMGVALLQPEQPGAQVLRVLVISPYALSLLVAMLALTLLIWGLEVRFIDLALLSAVYTMQFLLMSALSDVFFGFWGSLVVGMLLTLLLTYFLFRKLPSKALRWIVYGLVGFFTIIYPLSGLITELSQQNAFSMLLQAGLIIYITLLSLYVRQRSVAEPETNPEA